jgi:hypothetical protein
MSANRTRFTDVLHYRQNGIIVTNRYFSTSTVRYRVEELSNLEQTQGRSHPGVAIGLAVAAGDVVLIAPMVMLMQTTLALTVAIPVLVVACLVSLVSFHRSIHRELIARYRGRSVTLFSTTSEQQFGQVSRALIRAFEAMHERGEGDVR